MTIFGKNPVFMFGVIAVVGVSATAVAQVIGANFDLKDPKGVNAVTFLAESPLEPVTGNANGISGMISFDPQRPEASKGTFIIESDSVKTSNSEMTKHLAGPGWLDLDKHKQMTFVVDQVSDVKVVGDGKFSMKAVGKFTLKGKTIDRPIDIVVTYSKDALGKRLRGSKGDLLGIKSSFKFNRLDFDLGPAMPHIADEVDVIVAVSAMRIRTNSGDYLIAKS